MTRKQPNESQLPVWLVLVPEATLLSPLLAILFGGGWTVFLFMTGRLLMGTVILGVWIAVTASVAVYATRRGFVRVGMMKFLVIVAVLMALTPLFLL